jgi:diadenylate cyclase
LLSHFLQRWQSVSWISIVDILLVALLIYQFLALVKGTRAAKILLGAGVLAVAFYLARLGELTTVNWLVSTLLPYAVFALIVVFQNEIRHALAKVGRKLSFSRGTQPLGSEAYDDVVLAANLFSQNQTGALMVIEREIGLRTYIESGVPLDARISYDLLATVFRPSAPLHDGAAIIQKDRVAAAACFLPLSMNPVLSTQLGTRHRAGIGITEETDAVAVIVSEETGAISLAVAGSIERDLTADELRVRLASLLHRRVPPAQLPRPMLTEPQLEVQPEAPPRSRGGREASAALTTPPGTTAAQDVDEPPRAVPPASASENVAVPSRSGSLFPEER